MQEQVEQQELIVRSESVQRLYEFYSQGKFIVNRRYQRKLVWSVDEKEKLIDSILRDIPLPLFLVAENVSKSPVEFELIDGLQRLNAIFSFLENEFAVNGQWFDLDAIADTKDRKDRSDLVQKEPTLSRDLSRKVANYSIALSVFRSADQASVEEVFRRINSGGRRLSKQALRQAGTVSQLADLVRELSSEIRQDASLGHLVGLDQMPKLSITKQGLDYGVNVEDIFWVKNGVLRREDVRESADEQLILDILLDMLTHPLPSSGTRRRNAAYAFSSDDSENAVASTIEATITDFGFDLIKEQFLHTFEALRLAIEVGGQKFSTLVGAGTGGRSPRYYHVVFMAFYELMHSEQKRLSERQVANSSLNGSGRSTMNIPGGGGDWKVETKRASINGIKGLLAPAFEENSESEDYSVSGAAVRLETVLRNALIEQQLVELKQGVLPIQGDRSCNANLVRRLGKTACAMANAGQDSSGYIVIGVADNEADARRISEADNIDSIAYQRFNIVGIEREATLLGSSLSVYWDDFIRVLEGDAKLPRWLAEGISSRARLVRYHDLAVGLIEVRSGSNPAMYGTELYERRGSSTVQVSPDEYMRIFSRFTPNAG